MVKSKAISQKKDSILCKEMNVRCQTYLIDMQSQADNQYKFIPVYHDHLTKFVKLCLLKTKTAGEVVYVLLQYLQNSVHKVFFTVIMVESLLTTLFRKLVAYGPN